MAKIRRCSACKIDEDNCLIPQHSDDKAQTAEFMTYIAGYLSSEYARDGYRVQHDHIWPLSQNVALDNIRQYSARFVGLTINYFSLITSLLITLTVSFLSWFVELKLKTSCREVRPFSSCLTSRKKQTFDILWSLTYG